MVAHGAAYRSRGVLLALLLGVLPLAASAAPPVRVLPLACTPNRDCWIANHVDLDPGPGSRDYACGELTYDGHNGTDFAIRDRAAMEDGVAVLAAAAGRVRAARDGVAGASVRETGKASIKSRECGNGVVLEHGEGWETQYCHLRSGRYRKASMLSAGAPALVFYAEVFGLSAGDTLELRLAGPDGATLAERRVPIVERQARRLAYVGLPRTAAGWKPGVYRGEARLVRADGSRSPAASRAASVEVRK